MLLHYAIRMLTFYTENQLRSPNVSKSVVIGSSRDSYLGKNVEVNSNYSANLFKKNFFFLEDNTF